MYAADGCPTGCTAAGWRAAVPAAPKRHIPPPQLPPPPACGRGADGVVGAKGDTDSIALLPEPGALHVFSNSLVPPDEAEMHRMLRHWHGDFGRIRAALRRSQCGEKALSIVV